MFHITYKDEVGEAYILNTTGEHPFFVSDKGWVTARELSIADQLQKPDGSIIAISEITTEKANDGETFTTYNFEVEGYHTYYVLPEGKTDGNLAVWVHNNGNPCAQGGGDYGKNWGSKLDSNFYKNQNKKIRKADLADADDFIRSDGVKLLAHPNKHGVSKADQLDVLNNWEKSFSGININGRSVDIYWKNMQTVITQGGQKNKIITSYSNIDHARWSNKGNWLSDIQAEIYKSFNRNNQR